MSLVDAMEKWAKERQKLTQNVLDAADSVVEILDNEETLAWLNSREAQSIQKLKHALIEYNRKLDDKEKQDS